MKIEVFNEVVKDAQEICKDLIIKYQEMANNSSTKGEDLFISNLAYAECFDKGVLESKNDYLWYELSTDSSAIYPMPYSLSKQLISALLSFKHLNILYELPIEMGLYDACEIGLEEFIKEKDIIIKHYNETLFDDELEEDDC